jgi:anti-sigma-K factor RskA
VDTKEYIESGILEACVLCALSQEEQQQVYANVVLYPELDREVREIEQNLFRYCETQALTPPPHLEARIMQTVPGLDTKGTQAETSSPKVIKTIPLAPTNTRSTFVWRNAAALALLIGSLAVNYYFWSQGRHERQETLAITEQMSKLQNDQKQLADQLGIYQSAKAMMADTGTQTIVMHTMLPGHPMAATVYWRKASGEAFIAMDALPTPPGGMQYQLWVIQNGKPVSMGTLPNNMANSSVMQKVNMQVTAGEAFAISLEKRGGNPTPTAVYVLGKA